MSRLIVDSPKALGLAMMAGTSERGFRTAGPSSKALGRTATRRPRSARISTVGAGGDPPHRVELHAGKGAHGGEVLPVGLPVRPAVTAARRRVDPRASLGEERVELGERAERRHGDEEVAP